MCVKLKMEPPGERPDGSMKGDSPGENIIIHMCTCYSFRISNQKGSAAKYMIQLP